MRNFILLTLLVLSQVLGDIYLSRGMKSFGEINSFTPSALWQLVLFLLTNPWICLGVISLILSLLLYLKAISRLDLSYVLPLHASSYVLNAILAWLILGETIPVNRWISTTLISIGVLLVGFSKINPPKKTKIKKEKIDNILFFLLPFGLSKSWLAVILVSFFDAAGDLLLAMGMKEIGKLKILQVITNPLILTGILCQTISFVMFISVLSWADISFVRPATALTYVLSLLGAKFILHEFIPRQRLMGIVVVGMGVLVHR